MAGPHHRYSSQDNAYQCSPSLDSVIIDYNRKPEGADDNDKESK